MINTNRPGKIKLQLEVVDSIEKELRMAAELQRAVLPNPVQLPYLKSAITYQPLGLVSGDVYNFQQNRERELAVFLGDATGHGIAAALMTMMVHLGLENFPGNLTTDEVIRRLNKMIAPRKTGLSISSLFMRISPNGKLHVTHAGHPSLIIIPQHSQSPVTFQKGGCALGMFVEELVPYAEEDYELQGGDRVIAFTDGLMDWKNPRGESFGLDRVIDLVMSHRHDDLETFNQAVMDDILEFSHKMPCHDDLTLLTFEYIH